MSIRSLYLSGLPGERCRATISDRKEAQATPSIPEPRRDGPVVDGLKPTMESIRDGTFGSRPCRWVAHYRPMGFKLRLESNSPAMIDVAESAFGGFGPGSPNHLPDFRFRFLLVESSPRRMPEPVYQERGAEIRCVATDCATLVADRAAGTAVGEFSAVALRNPSYLRCHFLETALLAMLQPRGLMGVHGAAIVRNGSAILLRGASGSGKTTLCFAAARSGRFKALAEDVVWIDFGAKLWRGLPWWHHLLPDAVKLFPELASAGPPVEIRGKRKLAVDLERFHPGAATPEARPGPVVFLERRSGTTSRLRPIPGAEAWELWESGKAGTESDFPHYSRRVDGLLSGGTFLLELGADLDEALGLLQTLAL